MLWSRLLLGALSDRGAGRMPFLLFFTALCIGATFFIADVPPLLGLGLFIVANFAYQAALIYYDATLRTVSYPATRGKLSGMGTAIGYCGTVFVGLLIFFLEHPGRRPIPADGDPVPGLRDPDLPRSSESRRSPTRSRSRRPTSATPSVSSVARSRTPARCPVSAGSCSGGSSTPTRSIRVIVVMSVVTTEVFGLSDRDTVLVLLSLTLVAIAMSFVWGWLCDRQGPKRTLIWVLLSWSVGLLVGAFAISVGPSGLIPSLVAGAILGSGLGGVQVSDRVLMVRLLHPRKDRRVLRHLQAGRARAARSSASCSTD